MIIFRSAKRSVRVWDYEPSGQGYAASDTNRWKYGMLQRDAATGLDHTWWRKFESFSGRWTSPDQLNGSIGNPQSFNHYPYAANDPVNFIDPTGLFCVITGYIYEHYTYTAPDGTPGVGTTIYSKVECFLEGGGGYGIFPSRGGDRGGGGGGGSGGGVAGRPAPIIGFAKTDKWHGFNNRDFQRRFHRCYKEAGDPDASKEDLAAAYAEWVSRGSPQGGNCYGGGGGGERGRVPASDRTKRGVSDLRKILGAQHWPLVPSPQEIEAAKALATASAVVIAIYIIMVISTTPVATVP